MTFYSLVIGYNHIWPHDWEKANTSLTLSLYNASEYARANNNSAGVEIIKSKGNFLWNDLEACRMHNWLSVLTLAHLANSGNS